MPNLPDVLLHFVLKVFAPFVYKIAIKVLESNFKDQQQPLPARMRMRREFYDGLQARVDAYLAGQLAPGPGQHSKRR